MLITNIHTFLFLAVNSHTLLSLAANEEFKYNEIHKLIMPQEWLSDCTITAYFAMLQRIQSIEPSNRRSLFIGPILSDVMFTCINERNWNMVEEFWNSQLRIQIHASSFNSIFDADKICIATNVRQNHWTMIVIFFKHQSIVYYNSFNKEPTIDSKVNPKRLLEMLAHMARNEQKQFDRTKWRFTLSTCLEQVIFLLFFDYNSNYSE